MQKESLTSLSEGLALKLGNLKTILAGYEKVAIAYSGGVDSSLLLKVAFDVLGQNATAYFADSIVQTAEEKKSASQLAEDISAPLVILSFDLLSFPDFFKNSVERCYYCKRKIFSEIIRKSTEQGITVVADGTNLDDLGQFRPGAKAVQELGVKTPLVEAKLNKSEIRRLSQYLGLSSWNKHSSSCLATRIANDQPVTPKKLTIIESAEKFLRDKGFSGCRVRLDRSTCTLELSSGHIQQFMQNGFEKDFVTYMESLGIDKTLLDLKEREGINT